jgi:hypothetical protein
MNKDDDDGFATLREENYETTEELKFRTGNLASTERKARICYAIARVATVAEPSSVVLAAVGFLVLAGWN